MAGRPQEVVKPLVKAMTVVLSNGASLRMLTPALKTKPFIATQVRHPVLVHHSLP